MATLAAAACSVNETGKTATKGLCLEGYSSHEGSNRVMLLFEMDDELDPWGQLRPTSTQSHGEYWMSPARARSACEPDGEAKPGRAQSRKIPGGLEMPAVEAACLGAEMGVG